MLDLVLQILSVLGIILLVLVCLLTAVLLLVLFFPVTYRVTGGKKAEDFFLSAGADWLFGLLRFRYAYPQPNRITVKLLWILIYDSDVDMEEGKNDRGAEKKAQKQKANVKSAGKQAAEEKEISKNPALDTMPKSDEIGEGPKTSQEEVSDGTEGSSMFFEKVEKIKFTIRTTYDKIKIIWQNISYYVNLLREEETRLLFSHAAKRVFRILKNIRPRKLEANILFGSGEPDTTGYAFGIYGMFSSLLGPGVVVIPDFENAVFEGDFFASGYIASVVLVWHFLGVILDKKLWRFFDRLKMGKTTEETAESEERTKEATQKGTVKKKKRIQKK